MTPRTDQAVTITARETAELLPVGREDAPLGESEVAGPTLASLISAGTELASAYQGTKFPATPGYATVFRVEAVGTQVSKVRVGDHALCLGSHQAFQRRRENEIARVPDGLPPDQAVFARLMGVSMATLTTTAARPPARVVVTGRGPVGYLAAALFAACGYRVCACDPDERRRALTASRLPHVCVVPAPPLEDAAWAGEVVLVGVPWARRADDLFAHDLLHAVFHRYGATSKARFGGSRTARFLSTCIPFMRPLTARAPTRTCCWAANRVLPSCSTGSSTSNGG